MPAQWTAKIVGQMHIHRISAKDLAAKLNLHEKYVSAILNGHREPLGAEQRFNAALDEIIAERAKEASA